MLRLTDFLEDAQRQLDICNACRYCEGYCAVFPALERRATVEEGDLLFLANLCHDCGACYQACPYTSPHEFGVNIPMVMSQARVHAYSRYAWPKRIAAAFNHATAAVTVSTLGGVLLVLATVWITGGWQSLLSGQPGPGAFYRIVPYLAMFIPGMVASAFIVAVFWGGFVTFWRRANGLMVELLDARAWLGALADAAVLRNLGGGGPGCYYPNPDKPSSLRRVLHSLVVYGFLTDLVSTTLAAIWQDFLGQIPPYPLLSAPVVSGIAGGVAMIAGATGLIYLKVRRGARLGIPQMTRMDFAFLAILDLASITGMMTLALRGTSYLGVVLTIHLAVLVGLYATAPYGKFVHFVYRLAALVLNRVEVGRDTTRSQITAET